MIIFFYQFLSILFIAYLVFMWSLAQKPKEMSDDKGNDLNFIADSEKAKISIIVPFRNEMQILDRCIRSLMAIDYDKRDLEIVLVNDFSDDEFQYVLNPYMDHITLINSDKKGKKQAVEFAISKARHPWILCTDADCTFDENWLNSIDRLIKGKVSDLYVLPVSVKQEADVISRYQHLENMNNLAFNLAYYTKYNEVLLASGANLLFSKNAFTEVDPYSNNRGVSSGDDMFLLHAFKLQNKGITLSYDKGLWVETYAQKKIKNVIDQRIRWLSKMKRLKGDTSFKMGLGASVFHLLLLSSLLLGYFYSYGLLIFLFFILIKVNVQYALMQKVSAYKGKKIGYIRTFLFEIVYLFALPFLVFLSIFRNPKWKGRKIGV